MAWDTEALEAMTAEEEATKDFGSYKHHSGVSVAVVYEVETGACEFYSQNDDPRGGHGLLALYERLKNADVVVSFNGEYDRTVLFHALGMPNEPIWREYDILRAIWRAVGTRFEKGWKLGDVASRTLGLRKTLEGGALAPSLVSAGEIARLYTYCLQDVRMTVELYRFIMRYGFVIGPNGDKVEVDRGVSTPPG